jgi:DNA-binding cell septation regulator SpoVG
MSNPESSLVAIFGIRIPKWDLTMNSLRLIRAKSGGLFIAAPSEKYEDKVTKEMKYVPYWILGKESYDVFRKEIMKLIDEMVKSMDSTNKRNDDVISSAKDEGLLPF